MDIYQFILVWILSILFIILFRYISIYHRLSHNVPNEAWAQLKDECCYYIKLACSTIQQYGCSFYKYINQWNSNSSEKEMKSIETQTDIPRRCEDCFGDVMKCLNDMNNQLRTVDQNVADLKKDGVKVVIVDNNETSWTVVRPIDEL